MTAVIKSSNGQDAGSVRRIGALSAEARPLPQPVVDPELAALREQLKRTLAQCVARESQIERLQSEIVQTALEAEARGREAGLAQAHRHETERLAALSQGVSEAVELFRLEVAALEFLAPTLAIEGLERLLGDASRHAEFLRETVVHHLGEIETNTIIRIDVSPDDFADMADANALAAGIGRAGVEIQISDKLRSGECRIKLALGELDIGLPQQRRRLNEALSRLTEAAQAS